MHATAASSARPFADAAALSWAHPFAAGAAAMAALLGIYFGALTLVSGWAFTLQQFAQFWFYIVLLAVGFGVQVALFSRLRRLVTVAKQTGTMVAASGTTSTVAMISCCAHYVANAAPVLGATGLVAIATQFQVELLWVGMLLNAAGIVYMTRTLLRASREHARCVQLT